MLHKANVCIQSTLDLPVNAFTIMTALSGSINQSEKNINVNNHSYMSNYSYKAVVQEFDLKLSLQPEGALERHPKAVRFTFGTSL